MIDLKLQVKVPRGANLLSWMDGTICVSGPTRKHNTSGAKIRVWLCSCTGFLYILQLQYYLTYSNSNNLTIDTTHAIYTNAI